MIQRVGPVLLSERKVLVPENRRGPIYKFLFFSLDHKLPVIYDHDCAIRTVKNVLLTDDRYYLLMSVSK